MTWLKRAFLATLVAIGLGAGYLGWYWYRPLPAGEETYWLKPGMSLKSFAQELKTGGLLNEAHSFVWVATLTGQSRKIKAGEYRFPAQINAAGVLNYLVTGKVVEYPITLVEGWTFKQFLKALESHPKLNHTLTGLKPAEIMQRLGHPGEHPEGRFYPDTYQFAAGQNDLVILARAYEKMQARLAQAWEGRAANLPYRDPYQALIMASIVEKETGQPDERPMIAGVFVNRLRKGMKLQTDPTVIYGIGDAFDGNLRLRDLRHDTPYNTYTRTGLPPTPIAMPGGEALVATLHPADTRALYFVSRGNGSHVFSETLTEHNNAVIKYQLGGKPRAFSSNPTPSQAN